MQTIVFKATFDNTTKISAIIADDDHLYNSLEEQCSILFSQCEPPFNFSYYDIQKNKVLINSSQDILKARDMFKDEPILEFIVDEKDEESEDQESADSLTPRVVCEAPVQKVNKLTREERLQKVADAKKQREAARELKKQERLIQKKEIVDLNRIERAKKADEKRFLKKQNRKIVPDQEEIKEEPICEQTEVLQPLELAPQSEMTAAPVEQEKKFLSKEEKLLKKAEAKKLREEAKALKKQAKMMQKNNKLEKNQARKSQTITETVVPDSEKSDEKELDTLNKLELKLKKLQLKEQQKIEKIRVKFEKKQAKLQQQQDKEEKKQQAKQLLTGYPRGIQTVYIHGDSFLCKKPFKNMVASGRLEEAQQSLIAMNSAFNQKMQSIASGHSVQVIFHKNDVESNECAVDIIATATEAKNVGSLDSCLFVSAGHELQQLRKLGALAIKPRFWQKVMIQNTM